MPLVMWVLLIVDTMRLWKSKHNSIYTREAIKGSYDERRDCCISNRCFVLLSGCSHCFDAFVNAAFVYCGHNVVMEIQATIPSIREAIKGSYDERSDCCISSCCFVLLSSCSYWLLDVWQ